MPEPRPAIDSSRPFTWWQTSSTVDRLGLTAPGANDETGWSSGSHLNEALAAGATAELRPRRPSSDTTDWDNAIGGNLLSEYLAIHTENPADGPTSR